MKLNIKPVTTRSYSFFTAILIAAIVATLLPLTPFTFSVASAQTNPQINYQGKLTASTSIAVANGDYDMTFTLYDAPTGGTTIWTETTTNTVTDGLFSVMLGSTTALSSVDFNQTLYLGVEIESDGEMTPRKILDEEETPVEPAPEVTEPEVVTEESAVQEVTPEPEVVEESSVETVE